jgi:hypothetical protein
MIPHVCPNCKGTGSIIPSGCLPTDEFIYFKSYTDIPCFTCGGTGTIWELTEEEK